MKIIPKFQNGGDYLRYFNIYSPMSRPIQSSSGRSSSGSNSSSSGSGDLTEKDLFNMIKDINGLPNEMNGIITNLTNTLRIQNIEGMSTEDLSTIYLKNLYQIKVAAQNKDRYDTAIQAAQANGSMAEPAIDTNGNLFVQYNSGENKGKITTISPEQYFKNQNSYNILTTSNLANMRAYDMQTAGDQHIFDVIENSMGYEAFQKLLDQAKIQLGNSRISESVSYGSKTVAAAGLSELEEMSDEEKVAAIQAVQGIGETTISKSNIKQIEALVNYLVVSLPTRAKTWAILKTGIKDSNQATRVLVYQYLQGNISTDYSHTLKYPKNENTTGTNNAISSMFDGVKLNAAATWLAGYGNQKQLIINPGSSQGYFVDANFMQLLDNNNNPLGSNSNMQMVANGQFSGILDMQNVFIGNTLMDSSMFSQIILNDGNIFSIDLPYDAEYYNKTGHIRPLLDQNLINKKKAADQEIAKKGINLNDIKSIKENFAEINEIYQQQGLQKAYDANGNTINNWKRFAAINVRASNIAIRQNKNDLLGNPLLKEIEDNTIIENLIAISGDDNFDNNFISWNNDRFYEGVAFIPVNENFVSAVMTSLADIKSEDALALQIGSQSLQGRNNFDYGKFE